MKRILFALLIGLLLTVPTLAKAGGEHVGEAPAKADTVKQAKPFKVYLKNDEYKIYIRLNLYEKNVRVPGQDVYGDLDGYIGSNQGSGLWLITSSELKGKHTAVIEVINDFGSEDFTATITANADGTYSFKKDGGSTLKFAVRGKWQKIPGSFELVKRL